MKFGGEVHSDLWGPAPIATKAGKHYYISFTDDKTCLTHLYLLQNKSDAFTSYKDYEAWCDTHLDACVKILHSDRGGEYLGKEFTLYLKSKGMAQKLTVHDTPQHNCVAERHNRTIVERIHALLHSSGLPKTLWGEAARHVVWLLNRTSTKAVNGKTPYEAVFGKKPDLWHVREWGEKVWVHVEGGNKFGGRVKEGRWLGVDEKSKRFQIYWPDKRTASTECNVYHDKTCALVDRLKGEDWEFIETTTNIPESSIPTNPTQTYPAVSQAIPSPTGTCAPSPSLSDHQDLCEEDPVPQKHVRKPSQHIHNIIKGHGTTSARPSDPAITMGIQLPPVVEAAPNPVLEGEGLADQMMFADFEEYAMVAEMSEVEALEPRSLAETKRRPDWPLWEKAIHEESTLL
jgi:hypothetical protein